ncbi:MAG: DUF624 domain-containing protein [Clostridia bacterium]|nr:DUF624 domain-containing protein [Clostridia bacterium]
MEERENMGYRDEEPEEEDLSRRRPKKHLLYRIFNPEGSGKEAKPLPEGPDGLKKCFIIYKRNFTNLLYINLIKIIGNFPVLFAIYAFSGAANHVSTSPSSGMFAPLHGAMLNSTSPVSMALFGVHGGQSSYQILSSSTYVLLGLSLLVLFTFGIINTGTAYLLRGIVRRDPIFFWSDFKGSIKRNLKQGFILGFIDALLIIMLIYDLYFFYLNGSMMFYIMLIVLAFYMMVRYYLYPLMITFDLSIWKIFKNAFIFSILGFRRNILAFLAFLLIIGAEYLLLGLFYPLGIIFPLVVMFSSIAYFGIYAAWPKIKEIMIDPYVESK